MTETAFDRAFQKLLGVEGGYSNHAADRGGATRWGITEQVARANGYVGAMSALPVEWAARIYKAQYWDVLRLDAIALASYEVAEELFDTGVNMGVATAGRFLQRALNALNREGQDYPDLQVDGVVGPMTVSALRTFLQLRGPSGATVVRRALNGQQATRYLEIAESNRSQEAFVYGWLLQRVH